jgi:hypothetical protein
VVALLVGVAAGGTGVVWAWMHRARVAADVIEIDSPIRKNFRHDGLVMKEKDGAVRVVAGGVEARLMPAVANKKAELHLRALGIDRMITPQQEQTIRAVRRLAGAPGLAKKLNMTAEQIEKIKQVPLDWELPVAEAERAKIEALCLKWENSQGPAKMAADTALVEALKEIGPKAVAMQKQSLAKNTELAKNVLTPQQWQQYEALLSAKTKVVTPVKATPTAGKQVKLQVAPETKKVGGANKT